MWIKAVRRQHIHSDTADKREDGWPKMKLDDTPQFYNHYQQREQHDVQHAPFRSQLHPSVHGGSMSLLEQAEPAQLEKANDFYQGKNDRKEKYNRADKEIAAAKQFETAAKKAALMPLPELLDRQDR